MSTIAANVEASLAIWTFYCSVITRFGEIRPGMKIGSLLAELNNLPRKQLSPYRMTLNRDFAQEFNTKYETLKEQVRQKLSRTWAAKASFEFILASSFAVRLLWAMVVISASLGVFWPGHLHTSPRRLALLSLGLLQFVVAPLSFVVCCMRLGTNASDIAFHYICNALAALFIRWATNGAGTGFYIEVNWRFFLSFFVADFLLNLLVYFQVSEHFRFTCLVKHAVFGTMNTKTYFLVVLATQLGLRIDIGVWVLTALITVTARRKGIFSEILAFFGIPPFAVMFYCEHRINHCPIVYQQAHKFHHYLHDTTSFDAHVYGSGMNEEFLWILAETVPVLLAQWIFGGNFVSDSIGASMLLFPYCLNFQTLEDSWDNKGAHSRTSDSRAESWADFDEVQ